MITQIINYKNTFYYHYDLLLCLIITLVMGSGRKCHIPLERKFPCGQGVFSVLFTLNSQSLQQS